jgi:hypothetical protein
MAHLRRPRAGREPTYGGRGGPKGTLTLKIDSTLVDAHSKKGGAAGNYKRGIGFHPVVCFVDRGAECGAELLAGTFRPGDASSDNAADHLTLLDELWLRFRRRCWKRIGPNCSA